VEQLYPVLHSSISTERIRRLFVTLDNSDKYVFRYYCKKNLKIPKKQSKHLHQRSTDYTMAKTSKKYRLYNGQDIEEVVDIDECNTGYNCSHICVNNNGSAQCSCPSGYSLDSDQKTCKGDIYITYIFCCKFEFR
jgi:hypothetical protein